MQNYLIYSLLLTAASALDLLNDADFDFESDSDFDLLADALELAAAAATLAFCAAVVARLARASSPEGPVGRAETKLVRRRVAERREDGAGKSMVGRGWIDGRDAWLGRGALLSRVGRR